MSNPETNHTETLRALCDEQAKTLWRLRDECEAKQSAIDILEGVRNQLRDERDKLRGFYAEVVRTIGHDRVLADLAAANAQVERLRNELDGLAYLSRNRTTTRIMLRDRIHALLVAETAPSGEGVEERWKKDTNWTRPYQVYAQPIPDSACSTSTPAPKPPSGRQPIATAPKDGTIVILPGGVGYWRCDPGHEGWHSITFEPWPGRPLKWEPEWWQHIAPAPKEVGS